MASVFLQESDTDSIDTASTEESAYDSEKEYEVERILGEERDETGKLKYLLKWVGYPLYRATFEGEEQLQSDDLLDEWQKEKRDAALGKTTLFDLQEFYLDVEKFHEGQAGRRARRRAKRRKRGEVVDDEVDDDGEEEDVELPTTAAPKRTQTKTASTPREPKSVSRVGAQQAPKTPLPKQNAQSKKSAPSSKVSNSVRSAEAGQVLARKQSTTSTRPQTASTSTSSKTPVSKPTPPPLEVPTSKVFSSDWSEQKQRRERQRVNGETPKDSSDPKFKRLSIQNRFQKYGKNEPAPDPNALIMVDPKTGKTETPTTRTTPATKTGLDETPSANRESTYRDRAPHQARPRSRSPVNHTSVTSAPQRSGTQPQIKAKSPSPTKPCPIASAFQRRSPPPPARQKSPDAGPDLPISSAFRRRTPPPPARPRSLSPHRPQPAAPEGAGWRKSKACMNFRAGNCAFGDDCWFAHTTDSSKLRPPPESMQTCYYWHNYGHCSKEGHGCKFAHRKLDDVANRPGTFKQRFYPQFASTATPAPTHESSFTDAAVPTSATSAHPPADEPIDPNPDNGMEPREINEPTPSIEPLQGASLNVQALKKQVHFPEPSQTNFHDTAMTIERDTPAKVRRSRSARMVNGEHSHFRLDDLFDPEDEVLPRSLPEQDWPFVTKGIENLDTDELLAIPNNGLIEHVYIHMPPERDAEMTALGDYFKELGRSVFTPRGHGKSAWELFRKNYRSSCLLIVHPTEMFVESLPRLHDLLCRGGTGCRVFSIGVQRSLCLLEEREAAYEAQQLFPMGGITFLTDDVLIYYPEKATEIIEEFLRQAKHKPEGGELSKIGARPGLKQWLMDLLRRDADAQEQNGNVNEDGSVKDDKYLNLYLAVDRLCPVEDEDPYYWPDDASVPSENSHLWSPSINYLPEIQGLWESGEECSATDIMANLFAGEARFMAWKYRRFQFVFQRPDEPAMKAGEDSQQEVPNPDPRGYGRRYCHIGVVTPDEVLVKMRARMGKPKPKAKPKT